MRQHLTGAQVNCAPAHHLCEEKSYKVKKYRAQGLLTEQLDPVSQEQELRCYCSFTPLFLTDSITDVRVAN